MEIRRKKIAMKKSEGTAYFIGDWHAGLKSCAKDLVAEAVQIIADDPKLLFWVGMGDHIDAITKDDKRYEVESIDADLETPSLQMAWLKETIKPIADSCLGLHLGNHESTLIKSVGNFMQDIICPELEVDYLGYIALQTLIFPKGEHTLLTTHGAGALGGKTFERPEALKANKITRLRRMVLPLARADLYAAGHTHQLIGEMPPRRPTLVNTTTKLSKINKNGSYQNGTIEKIYVFDYAPVISTGSFLATYTPSKSNYAERNLYSPLDVGMVRVTYNQAGEVINIEEVVLG